MAASSGKKTNLAETADITLWLDAAREGDRDALDRVLATLYQELHAMARRQLAGQLGHTLDATALVHEAYLKLVGRNAARFDDRAHFFAYAASAMRSVVVDYARQRLAQKRGGDQHRVAELPEDIEAGLRLDEDTLILAWDDASATAEAGQTTTIDVCDADGTVIATHDGLAGTSYDVPDASFGSESIVRLRVYSERSDADGDFVSLQFFEHWIRVANTALATEQGVALATEGNETLISIVGCGGDRDAAKRPVMAQVAAHLSDKCILTSDNPRSEDPNEILRQMNEGVEITERRKVLSITDRKEAIRTACMLANKGDIILLAGKGHEKYQEIKGVKYAFDDKAVLKELFNELGK